MATDTSADESGSTMLDDMVNYLYLAIRLVAALVVVWYGSYASRYDLNPALSVPFLMSSLLRVKLTICWSFIVDCAVKPGFSQDS